MGHMLESVGLLWSATFYVFHNPKSEGSRNPDQNSKHTFPTGPTLLSLRWLLWIWYGDELQDAWIIDRVKVNRRSGYLRFVIPVHLNGDDLKHYNPRTIYSPRGLSFSEQADNRSKLPKISLVNTTSHFFTKQQQKDERGQKQHPLSLIETISW